MTKSLTMTIVFQAGSLNYGEGIANISELKNFIAAMEKCIHMRRGKVCATILFV